MPLLDDLLWRLFRPSNERAFSNRRSRRRRLLLEAAELVEKDKSVVDSS